MMLVVGILQVDLGGIVRVLTINAGDTWASYALAEAKTLQGFRRSRPKATLPTECLEAAWTKTG